MIAWRKILAAFAALLAPGLPGPAASVEFADPNIPARIELHPVRSMTLSDEAFLLGEPGTPVTLAGELRLPAWPAAGRLPALILLHGSGGILSGHDIWARQALELGLAVFVLDSLSGRGLASATSQAELGRLNMVADAYAALALLARHPRIDPARVAVLGFSRGGNAALYSSLQRFGDLWNRSGTSFAAHLAYYPDCGTRYVGDTEVSARPIRVFAGWADDLNPAQPCLDYVYRLRVAGAEDVEIAVYPDAPHGFDNPLGPPSVALPAAETYRNCRIVERPAGVLVNAADHRLFTPEDPCIERGAHLGANQPASFASRAIVLDVLTALAAE
jgi:dienelactone hydrolase